jgi:hypothetical protein
MATRVQRTTAEQATALPIFQTVDSKAGKLLDTAGTFAIVENQFNSEEEATLNKPLPEKAPANSVVIFEGTYKGGQGYYDGAILRGYSLYIYPNGYFGVQSMLIADATVKVTLTPAIVQAEEIRQKQLDYINTKIGQNVIDNPKDGNNAAV